MAESSRIGVVLSAGGVRGVYAHTGFLQAIEQMNIPISAVAGCSAGAIVGGVYASGTPLGQWVEAIQGLEESDFWQPGSWTRTLWKLLASRGRTFTGISGTDVAIVSCRNQLAVDRFEQCHLPFHALATSLSSGGKILFSEGEMAPRIIASAAIPLLYQPVEIAGEYYCDGGIMDLGPTDAICCRHHLDVLIVNHVANRSKGFHGIGSNRASAWPILDIIDSLMFRSRPWYLSDQPLTFRRCPCGCKALIVVVEPELPDLPWPQTERGPEIQVVARDHLTDLLAPHIDAILHRPRMLLDRVRISDSPTLSCGESC
ncbi:MAG: patatin-like phospholipase family protein [Mariprofundaceae bacterium]|nr:patatin-like phospholipase family protein [Mariprofundaceae bacterium]